MHVIVSLIYKYCGENSQNITVHVRFITYVRIFIQLDSFYSSYGDRSFAKYRSNVIKLRQLPNYSTVRSRSLIACKSLISRRSFSISLGPKTLWRYPSRAAKDFPEVIGRTDSDGLRLTQERVARRNFKETPPRLPRSIRRTEIRRKQSDSGEADDEEGIGGGYVDATRRRRERNLTNLRSAGNRKIPGEPGHTQPGCVESSPYRPCR